MPTNDQYPDLSEVDGSPVDEALGLDLELVEKMKAETLILAGFSIADDDGAVRASIKQLQVAALQSMQDRHTVTGKRDLAAGAVTQFELYQELLPQGPGAHTLPHTDEEREVQKRLMKDIWSYANVGITSFVQKNVAGLGLVLCEAKVARTKLNEETGKKQPTTELARFLTADGDLIMTYFTGPAGAAFVRAARKLDAQLGLVADRRPELAVPVAKQLGSVVRQAVSAIPHADQKAIASIKGGPAGNDPEGA